MDESLLQHLLQRPIDPEKQPSDASLAQNTPLLPAVVNIEPNVQTENSTFEYDEHIRPSNLRQRIKRTPVGILNLQQRTKRINLSLKQGIKRFFDKAVEAAAMEITQIIAKKVYKYVHSTNGKTAMQSHMLINEKLAPSGNLVKIKGRWVVNGKTKKLEPWQNSASPTLESFEVLATLKIAVIEHHHIWVIDITGAYLHALWIMRHTW